MVFVPDRYVPWRGADKNDRRRTENLIVGKIERKEGRILVTIERKEPGGADPGVILLRGI